MSARPPAEPSPPGAARAAGPPGGNTAEPAGPAYDSVAELYDRAFSDIRVRKAEVAWLDAHLAKASPRPPQLLEVGCGTGALLRHLAPRLARGVGVDVSREMLARAEARAAATSNVSFQLLSRPGLPFADNTFDVCVSFLSFRYLDWHRMFSEILRVLRPGGRFLMVDLVRAKLGPADGPRIARSLVRHALAARDRRFSRDLAALVAHPAWQAMLAQHPMRARAEYRDFFSEMLPGARFDVLDVMPGRRVIALDSGPLGA
jgi:SAM-dependent methyltransferase